MGENVKGRLPKIIFVDDNMFEMRESNLDFMIGEIMPGNP
ncbi:hypothetical protein N692_06405 [Lactiplantibacillus plantarum EGD-AQ4]|nr:hypothetical protein N692_06405 [Lactiplantibacillus plantarum EGD-AQ4]